MSIIAAQHEQVRSHDLPVPTLMPAHAPPTLVRVHWPVMIGGQRGELLVEVELEWTECAAVARRALAAVTYGSGPAGTGGRAQTLFDGACTGSAALIGRDYLHIDAPLVLTCTARMDGPAAALLYARSPMLAAAGVRGGCAERPALGVVVGVLANQG